MAAKPRPVPPPLPPPWAKPGGHEPGPAEVTTGTAIWHTVPSPQLTYQIVTHIRSVSWARTWTGGNPA